MYGSTLGSTYELEHSNDINSTIKTYLEGDGTESNLGWYGNNLLDYEEYIADAIYCNDREVVTDDSKYEFIYENSAGDGIGENPTLYGIWSRITLDSNKNLTEVSPTFKCNNSNDRFTINNSTLTPLDGNGTNKKLRYPVGLITADETIFAGGYWDDNSSYYLYAGLDYWTMSPFQLDGSAALVFDVRMEGIPGGNFVAYSEGVRPVISLESDALKYGTGVIGDEFRISA